MSKSSGQPAVTVLMPVYNGARFLNDSIESILRQSFEDFEFLIVDDGSSDATAELVAAYSDPRLRLIRHKENLGLTAALNRGLKEAKGKYIARMDHDDTAAPERLAKQYEKLEAEDDLVAVGCSLLLMNVHGEHVGTLPVLTEPEEIKRALAVTNPFAHPAMMFRREVVQKLDGYDPDAHATEDYDLWVRLSAVGRLSNLEEPLLSYRLNPHGISLSRTKSQKRESEKIANRQWLLFGDEGPAPLKDWPRIWPKNRGMSVEKRVVYATLHLLFAKGYRRRGDWTLAFRHLVAAAQWHSVNPATYFTALMFLLPYRWFSGFEGWMGSVLDQARAGRIR